MYPGKREPELEEPFKEWRDKYGELKGNQKFILSVDKIRELVQCVRDNQLSDPEMEAYMASFLSGQSMVVKPRRR